MFLRVRPVSLSSSPITSWKIDGEKWKYFLGDGDCSHENKRHLFLGRNTMTKLYSILRNRDITLLTKVWIVKITVFPVVTYRCERRP